MKKQNTSTFEHDSNNQRFSLEINDKLAFVSYVRKNDIYYLTHSEIPPELRGRGIGQTLVNKVFDYLNEHKLEAVAICSYVQRIQERNARQQHTKNSKG